MRSLDELAETTIASAAIEPTPVEVLRARASRRRSRHITITAGVVVVALVLATPLILRAQDDSGPQITTRSTGRVPKPTIRDLPAGIPQPSTVTRAQVDGVSGRSVIHDGVLWAFGSGDSADTRPRLVGYDTNALKEIGSVRLPLRSRYVTVGIAVSGSSAWVLSQSFDGRPYVVTQVDTSAMEVRQDLELPGPGAFGATESNAIIATPDAAWIGLASLLRVDAETGVVSSFAISSRPTWMGVSDDSLWMLFPDAQVTRFDLASNQIVRTLTVGDIVVPWTIAVDNEAVWVTGNHLEAGRVQQVLIRIDPKTYETTTFDIPAVQVATGDGEVWVQLDDDTYGALNKNGLVGEFDPETGKILRTVRTRLRDPPINGPTFSIGEGSIWISGNRITPNAVGPTGTTSTAASEVPAGSGATTREVRDGASTIADLRKRKLNSSRLSGACPETASNLALDGVGRALRAGPVAAALLFPRERPGLMYSADRDEEWHSVKLLWLVDAKQRGPVIVRGARVDKPGAVAFSSGGTGRMRVLSLDGDVNSTAPPTWRDIPSQVLIREPGCYRLQVDGTDFQSVFLLRASAR